MVISSCKFLSNIVFKFHPIVIRMDNTKFLVTWDDDTGNVGLVNLTKDELKEFTTRSGSDKGEHITSMLKTPFSLVLCILSEVRREVLMETDDLVFKLRLKFDICCMVSEARRVLQDEEDPILLCCRSMCLISA